jgi:cellulose synthase operon protein C
MTRIGSIRQLSATLLLGALTFAPFSVKLHAQTAQSTTQSLLDKAHALEVRGRLDMAAQTWQQVLLADPNNTEALGGLARAAKYAGNNALASTYLDRLRAINPNDPNIGRVDNMGSQQNQSAQLKQAGKLAEAGQYAQAMAIYRQVFGNNPPAGDWALAYYETESATDDGRAHAVAGLRSLVAKYPSDSRYQIALGRILTYDPKTRPEGRQLLERHPNDPQATEALRQSLVWDSANPASAAEIRAYLAKHNDAQLATALRNQPKPAAGPRGTPQTPEQIAAGEAARARGVEEQAAYSSLNAKRLDDAELRFKAILAKDPSNPRALAGLGYVRMQQSNFAGAIGFLEQAKQNGLHDVGLETALSNARFYATMAEATTALNENDLTTAEQQFRGALTQRPASPEALEGLGGTLLKAQQAEAAIPVFESYTKARPSAPGAWRGLFMAYYGAGNASQALLVDRRIPPGVHAQLMRDPEFLRTLASAYSAVGRDADAQRVLHSALELPFPAGGAGLKIETQLQYASLLQAANHLDQAGGLYRQILAADVSNTAAWQGLIRVQHAMKDDAQALVTLQNMPPSSYDMAMRDPGFATTVAAVYQSQNKLDLAQQILEKAVNQQISANQKPSVPVLLQLAGIYLLRNDAAHAFPIYRQILTENPDRTDAWRGLLAVLHSSGRDQEALAQVQQIPPAVRSQLENDVEYLQTIAAVYNALGQPQEAMLFLNRVQQHYAAQHTAAPADVEIQDAWLLFNGGNDSGLYRQLMVLGARQDLSDEQRRTVQTIWTNWAVRRANQAAGNGNIKRSLLILNAAAKSFPDNPGVLRALASGYARAGLPQQAVAIFKSQDMTSATASDYKSAVGAALAANDMKNAEGWLRYGLDAYPKDSEMLTLGAKFEQARGDSTRAAEYYRASLAAMPPGDPGAELANELSQPMPVARLPKPAQPQDLATLLSSPEAMDAPAQEAPVPRPYLPSYGNVNGTAPVQISTPGYPSSSVVPPYMTNPAYRTAPQNSTLGGYVPYNPQAANAVTPASNFNGASALNSGSYASTPAQGGTYQDYQRQQIQRLTEQAQQEQPLTLTPQDAPLQIAQQQETFGPYVPYMPPTTQNYGYTPSPVPIQLGDSTPRISPPQRDVTDVLPTAKYVPNARASHTNSRAMTGVSHPPADDVSNSSTQNAQYRSQIDVQPQSSAAMQGQSYPPLPASSPTSQNGDSYGQQYPQPGITTGTTPRRTTQNASAPVPPAINYPGVSQPLSGSGYPVLGPPASVGTPPTDADLAAKSVPPLRGGYNPAQPNQALSQRQQTELDLAALESSYSGWVGGTGFGRYRSGTPGLDRLTDIESPFEASAVLGKSVRATVVALPVFLNSGTINTASFQNSTGTVPILGTLSAASPNTPPQQFSSGVGGELQLTAKNLGVAAGYTPYGFLVSNVTGRVQWRPLGGHFTLFGDRDSVKDTQLSYGGLHDPGTASAVYSGNIWGGVISTGGGVRVDIGSEKAGLYISGDGATLTGFHVLDNRKYEGIMGAYFRVKTWPGYGTLNIGGSFFGMHYDFNERGMTYGQGGYFSPNVYFLATVPVRFDGYYKTDFHYTINGSVGLQTFQEASALYYPLPSDLGTQTGLCSAVGTAGCTYAANSNTGLNYSINTEESYRIADHWYVGGFLSANNTNNYNTVTGGFFVRYMFKPQYSVENTPTGLFPTNTGFRPLRVP